MSTRSEFRRSLAIFYAAACVVGLIIYRKALEGTFFSDDRFLVVGLGHSYDLSADFLLQAFDLFGALQHEMMVYAPLYLLTSRIEWALFGEDTLAYHVVNVLVHAANATLIAALIHQQGIARNWAYVGGAFFLVHPANVEAVAWISQLRSILALACGLAALLLVRTRPLVATVFFASALLFKISAVMVLPIALGLYWCQWRKRETPRLSISWFVVWAVTFCICAYPAFDSTSLSRGPEFEGSLDLFRNAIANASRYVLMAGTSAGLSGYHLPPPVRSWWNTWWLASIPVVVLIGWRIARGLVRGHPEAAWWLGAGTAFVMVSQVFPFYYPLADRYLYFMLPGALIAVLLWKSELEGALVDRVRVSNDTVARLDQGLRIASALLIVFFAYHSSQRAWLWENDGRRLTVESANKYPAGSIGHYVRASIEFERGNVDAALHELEALLHGGWYRVLDLFATPGIAPHLNDPRVVSKRRQVAGLIIEDYERAGTRTQHQKRALASARFYLGDYDTAIADLEQALRDGGPYRDEILGDLEMVRKARREGMRANAAP